MFHILFRFQTGAIRRLSEYCINIILHPYSSCQVNFSSASNQRRSAVDPQSRKIYGRLTARCVSRVYRQYFGKLEKISVTKLVNFRRSTADCPNRFAHGKQSQNAVIENRYSIFCEIIAFMALRCAENADSIRDIIFHCTYFV